VIGEREIVVEAAGLKGGLSRLEVVKYESQDVRLQSLFGFGPAGTGLLKASWLQWRRVIPLHGVVAACK
jgi:hypothetical protein